MAAAPAARVSATTATASAPARASKPAPTETKKLSPSQMRSRAWRPHPQALCDTRSEMKKVTWPDQETTRNLTIVVIGISVVLGICLVESTTCCSRIFEALP